MTRRQAREQERIRTASVPVTTAPEPSVEPAPVAAVPATPAADARMPAAPQETAVSGSAVFAEPLREAEPVVETAPVIEPGPVAAAESTPQADSGFSLRGSSFPITGRAADTRSDAAEFESSLAAIFGTAAQDHGQGAAPLVASGIAAPDAVPVPEPASSATAAPVPASVPPVVAEPATEASDAPDEAQTVNPDFGRSIGEPAREIPEFAPSFDDIVVGDSTGSQHIAPNALIFTQGEPSLSGPVASTGEVLVTGSYELPAGIGSRGHALGTTDGKEVDAVLIDGELPPTSSPTPIAASAAVSTLKPAGEVIRPPAPEKGNKLLLTLAIVAGGLALALAAALIVAFATNVFGR